MITAESQRAITTTTDLSQQYRDNLSRHLLGVARHLQSSMMQTLQRECGHADLRLGFAPYITLIGEHPLRPTELAEMLGITRQACNQVLRQIEAAGYIETTPDPEDGRARQLALSDRGKELRLDGVRIVTRLDEEFTDIVGAEAFAESRAVLGKIYGHLALGLAPQATDLPAYGGMGGLLPRLSDYTLRRLMELTIARGHPGLKLSFGQVLSLIGPAGGRIQQMAAIHDVSKQAISAIATELEEMGYLRRDDDPGDARQVVLRLTTEGERLIADSVASVAELSQEFAAIAGKARMARASEVLRDLYHGLRLEEEIFENSGSVDISLLAHNLTQQLGPDGSQALAQLLLESGNK
jgi:DNA-binding MarR family transcriptional regulator